MLVQFINKNRITTLKFNFNIDSSFTFLMGILYKLFLNIIFIHLDLSNSVVNILSLKVEKSTSFFISKIIHLLQTNPFYDSTSCAHKTMLRKRMLLLMFTCIWQKASKVHWRLGQCFCRTSHELYVLKFAFFVNLYRNQ